jgi:hypothetical protein
MLSLSGYALLNLLLRGRIWASRSPVSLNTAMSGLRIPRIPRFVRLSASTTTGILTHVIFSSPRTCILGPEEFASSSDNSPSPGLPWYVCFRAHGCRFSLAALHNSLFVSRKTLLVSCGCLQTVTGVRRHNGRLLYHSYTACSQWRAGPCRTSILAVQRNAFRNR